MKKYMTPDFDVTVYEIKDVIAAEIGSDDDENFDSMQYYGGTEWE